MKNRRQSRLDLDNEKGAVTVLAALYLVVLLAAAGLAFDLGHYYVVREELKNAADAGALAGVRAISPYDFQTMDSSFSPQCSLAITTGTQRPKTIRWINTAPP